MGRAALDPRAAPAARAARARLARAADREGVRRARARRRPRAPVRADERVRRRLRDRGHDRARGRGARATRRRRAPRRRRPRARRGRARRLDLPAGRRARRAAAATLLGGPPPDAALLSAWPTTATLVLEPDDGRRLGLPAADRGARGRARRSGSPRCCGAKPVAQAARPMRRPPTLDPRARAGRGGARGVRAPGSRSSPAARAPARPRRSA